MKRSTRLLTLFLLTLCVCLLATACGGKKTSTDPYLEVSNPEALRCEIGADFDASAIVINYVDATGKKTAVAASDLTVTGTVDTATVGEYTLTFAYNSLTLNVTVSVTPRYDILAFELPEFVDQYKSNLLVTQEQSQFTKPVVYVVGDDNPFIFLPRISALDEEYNHVYLNSYVSVSTLELKNGEVYTALTGDDLAAVVAIDETASSYDFTEAAIGNTYRLTVKPADDTSFSLSFEFTVVDAWNVYTAADLSRADNREDASVWADLKAANGIDNTPISGLAFQNNIALTVADLPASYLHTSTSQTLGKEGWMRDGLDLYEHTVPENGSFTLYGNSFTLDTSALPTVPKGDSEAGGYGTDFSNTALFKFIGQNTDKTYSGTASAKVQDINIIGNACLVTEDQAALDIGLGGIIAFKNKKINATIDNTIVKMTFIAFFGDYESDFELTNSRAFDSLQNAAFIWGAVNMNIENCILKYCGGPAIIAQLNSPNDPNPEERSPYLSVDEATVMDNPIVGDEVWFNNLGVTPYINQMMELSLALQGAATTINNTFAQMEIPMSVRVMSLTQKNENNLDALQVLSVLMPEGTSIFGGTVAGDMHFNGASQTDLEAVAALRAKIAAGIGDSAAAQVVIMQCNGILMWTDSNNLYLELNDNPFTTLEESIAGQADPSATTFFDAETMTIYMGSAVIVLGTFNAQAAQ